MNKKSSDILLIVVAIIVRITTNIFFINLIILLSDWILKFNYSIIFYIFIGFIILTEILKYIFEDFLYILLVPQQIPQIQYGKFPFEVVYTVDGELFVVKDTFVCEYKNTFFKFKDKDYEWNTYLENSGESYLKLCDVEKSGQLQSICLDLGNVNYYMLSDEKDENYSPGEYVFNIRYPRKPISLEDAKKDYDIKIISAKFSDPIENEFEYRTVDKIRLFLFGGGKEDN